MAASCTNYDATTHKGEYVIGSMAEINKLPTTKKYGTNELENYAPCCNGSECIVLNPTLSVCFLDGDTDSWVIKG